MAACTTWPAVPTFMLFASTLRASFLFYAWHGVNSTPDSSVLVGREGAVSLLLPCHQPLNSDSSGVLSIDDQQSSWSWRPPAPSRRGARCGAARPSSWQPYDKQRRDRLAAVVCAEQCHRGASRIARHWRQPILHELRAAAARSCRAIVPCRAARDNGAFAHSPFARGAHVLEHALARGTCRVACASIRATGASRL